VPQAPETQRTTLRLRRDLLIEVERELDTSSPSVAVNRALEEFINLRRRQRLLEMDLLDLTPESLQSLRLV